MEIENLMQKILIVDDISANIKELIDVLKSPDYEIIIATGGKTALELATYEEPDLIILNIAMPEMDGYTVCTQLKADAATQPIPVIFIAQQGIDDAKGLELGAVDYITKPFHAAIVKARVKNYLELKRQRDILKNLSTRDNLTGIPNRSRFDKFLEHEWRRAIRGISHLSLIVIDIDYFKLFNEHYGYVAGDECLKQIAHALDKTAERATDLVARYEGDKFACILPLTDAKGAIVMANKLRERVLLLNIPHAYSEAADHVTVSQGIATLRPYPNSSPTMLIIDANKALSEAKASGRNQMKSWE